MVATAAEGNQNDTLCKTLQLDKGSKYMIQIGGEFTNVVIGECNDQGWIRVREINEKVPNPAALPFHKTHAYLLNLSQVTKIWELSEAELNKSVERNPRNVPVIE